MKLLRYLLFLAAGAALGWFARGALDEAEKERAARAAVRTPPPAPVPPAPRPPPEPPPAATDTEGAGTAPAPVEPPETAPEPEAASTPERDGIEEMIEALGPQWKAWAKLQAKQRAEGLFAGLGLSEELQHLIEQALIEDAERQTERALAMMLGEAEIDPDAFSYFLGLPEDLSPELERELATMLTDSEISAVRTRVKEAYGKQIHDFADMQISMMGVPGLTADQKTRMREVFTERDMMREQFTKFAEMTRDREKLAKLTDEKELAALMRENFAGTRDRMRDILTPEQFTRYEAYEEMMIKQAQMNMKMMASMLEPKKGTSAPDGK